MTEHRPETAPDSIPPKWIIAATALAGGATVDAAAFAAGVHRRTLYVWRRNPRFTTRLNQIRADAMSAACGKLVAATTAAADVLVNLLSHDNPAVRLRAAGMILNVADDYLQNTDLESEFAAL